MVATATITLPISAIEPNYLTSEVDQDIASSAQPITEPIGLSPAKPISNLTDLHTKPAPFPDMYNPKSPNFNRSVLPKVGPYNFGLNQSLKQNKTQKNNVGRSA